MPERGVLVHEWLSRTGGSENVFDAMVGAFPEADLLCLWSDVPDRYPGRTLTETWLGRTPLRRNKAAAAPLVPATWRNRRPGGYDWALVSSHMFAHHVSFVDQPADFRKYVYVHSPARYLWNPELDARGRGILPRLVAPALRSVDRTRAQEAVSVAANSMFVRERVRSTWHRDAHVVYPPVDVRRISRTARWADALDPSDAVVLASLPDQFLLGASRFVRYKRLDLVIEAGEIAGLPVVLAGAGPEEAALRDRAARASVPVHVLRGPTDSLLFALYQAALAFVFPAVEDFGIMPVEAMAAGTPVVVGPVGGARESVEDGVTGAVAESTDPHALAEAVERCARLLPVDCVRRAEEFDADVFDRELRSWVSPVASVEEPRA
ncbi:glycosyltransferase [Cellulomonas cellasea]|uniref:D-inositol 3-phosphate glycosyltransferase n=2 Tax=Cellulomonas cellasea TaxID=43670 RepID=A0A0A0BA05_9CELL|nr:glycosyltransferase [Cellulomonas cellasea]KGM02121.1 glycosyl transferase [Cellulomonas cellasea DSM 20118]GEA89840.1 glycosyl transferase [Cellulomonas cellasea]